MPAATDIKVNLSEAEEFEALLHFAGEVGRFALDHRDPDLARLVKGLTDKLQIVARKPESTLQALAEQRDGYSLARLFQLAEQS